MSTSQSNLGLGHFEVADNARHIEFHSNFTFQTRILINMFQLKIFKIY